MTTEEIKEEIAKRCVERFKGYVTWSSSGRVYIQDAIDESFLAGKSQATKEILKEEIKFLQILCMSGGITTYAMSTVFKRIEELKQQLKKLGENGK